MHFRLGIRARKATLEAWKDIRPGYAFFAYPGLNVSRREPHRGDGAKKLFLRLRLCAVAVRTPIVILARILQETRLVPVRVKGHLEIL